MKKLQLMALALVLGTMSLFANNETPEVSKDEIRKQIVELVQASEPQFTNETIVKLTFTFSSEGEIVVLGMDSKNKEVIEFVKENLNYKKIENPGKQNKKYTLSINVKNK
ncbi:hypothetical protein [Lutibacter sp. B1]|uniref:hypothetical protein n=1 Tax=Lutibacter sp. B1 TaxID=2725996 RepID=UPI0014571109|nr:hypothetical protein [Lutibacter sp. B1]NLP57308.1 hypothetical protein [Lutibacter sp. B1]